MHLVEYVKNRKAQQLCFFWNLPEVTHIFVLISEQQPNSSLSVGVPTVDVVCLQCAIISLSLLSVLGNYEISSISHVTMSPSRQNNLVSMYSSLPLSKSSYSVISAFCTEDNIPQCISYINQVRKYLAFIKI